MLARPQFRVQSDLVLRFIAVIHKNDVALWEILCYAIQGFEQETVTKECLNQDRHSAQCSCGCGILTNPRLSARLELLMNLAHQVRAILAGCNDAVAFQGWFAPTDSGILGILN